MPDGSGGIKSTPDNLIQVGPETSTVTIRVAITVNQPIAGINFGTDTFDMNTASTDSATGKKSGGLTLNSMGAGTDIIGASVNAGGVDCSMSTIDVASFTSSNVSYLACNFKDSTSQNEITGIVPANQPKTANLTINLANYKLNSSNTASPQQIIIYPYINFTRAGVVHQITFTSGGFPLYVQFYTSQAAANTAITSNQRPSGAPAYGGGTTSTAQTTAGGSTILNFLNQIISFILGLLQELAYAVFYFLVSPLIEAMLKIQPYTDAFVAVIYPGWIIIRNVCNIFFILSLIIIAMATLFRVESYQYKHLLVQLLIAALLINFSLVIAQAILGLASTVQTQFLGDPNNITQIRTLAGALMNNNNSSALQLVFSPINNINTGANTAANNNTFFAGIIQSIFWLSLSFGTLCVFIAIAAYLFIRVVALWVLLMISPIAYACGVLPSTAQYRTEWWNQFLKYAFFTPIMAFFLNLSAVMVYNAQHNPVFSQILNGTSPLTGGNSANSSLAGFLASVGSNILLLIFLLAGLKVSEQAGIIGASKITGWAQQGIFAPFAAAGAGLKAAGGFAGRKYNEATAKYIRGEDRKVSGLRGALFAAANPLAFGKAWSKEREEKTHRAQAKAESAALEVVQQRFSSPKTLFKGGYKILPHVLQHEKQEEDEKTKFLQNMSRENVAKTAAEYFKLGDDEDGMAYKRSVIKLAMSKGYIDDIVELAHTSKEGQEMIKFMKDNKLVKDEDFTDYDVDVLDEHGHATGEKKQVKGLIYNNRTRRAMYKSMFAKSSNGEKIDHAAARLITEEGEVEGMNTGHLEYMTDMYFNNQTGHYEEYHMDDKTMKSDGERLMAAAEIAKRDSRRQATIAWHSLMSADGKYFSEDIFRKVSKSVSENPGWMQERSANMLVAGTLDETKLDKIRETFLKTGDLDFRSLGAEKAQVIQERLAKMKAIDERAFISIVSRFVNDASPQSVDNRIIANNLKINGSPVPFKDETITTTKNKSGGRDKNQPAANNQPQANPTPPPGTIYGPDGRPIN